MGTLKWKFCNKKGEESEEPTDFQIDKVGNIFMKSGQVSAKACQNCGHEFLYKSVQDEIRQNIDKYKCTKCEFESNNPQEAIIHTIKEKSHKLDVEDDSRIVGYSNTLSDTPLITMLDDDCIILCGKCNDINKP